MSLTEITDHVDQAQARMVKRFKSKTNIDKIIKIRVDRLQIVEGVINQMTEERALSTASGVNLDGIGEFYGEQGERANRTDDQYRAFLQTLPAKLRQAGQHEILIQALVNLSGASSVEAEYFWPRAMALYALVDDVDSLSNEEEINREMQSIHAEGIRLDIGLKQKTESFVFSLSASGDVPANSGFSTLADGSDGGKFIKLIS